MFQFHLAGGATSRLYFLSAFLFCVCHSYQAEGAVFSCDGDSLSLDTDHPEERSVQTNEGYELRCNATADSFTCSFLERQPDGTMKTQSGAKVNAGARGFQITKKIRRADGTSQSSIECTNAEATETYDGTLNNYECRATDHTTGAVLASFPLFSNGAASSFMVNGQSAHCTASLNNISCGDSNGAQDEGYDYHMSFIPFGAQFFTQTSEIQNSLIDINCQSTGSIEPSHIDVQRIGVWEEAATIGLPRVSFDGFQFLSEQGQPEIVMRDESGFSSWRFDEDLSAWGSTGSSFPLPPRSNGVNCDSYDMLTESTLAGVYGNLRGCIYWRSAGTAVAEYVGTIPTMTTYSTPYNYGQTAVGEKLFIWGGFASPGGPASPIETNRGFLFDHLTRTWNEITTSGAPSPRSNPIVIPISENEVFVWGGIQSEDGNNGTLRNDGAIFSLNTGTWRQVAQGYAHPAVAQVRQSPNFFSGKHLHAFWTGSEVLFWGGWNSELGFLSEGHLYNPSTDSWRRMADGPPFLADAVSMITSEGFLLWGGYERSYDFTVNNRSTVGWFYNLNDNSWKRTIPEPRLSNRFSFNNAVSLEDKILFIGSNVFEDTPPTALYLRLTE